MTDLEKLWKANRYLEEASQIINPMTGLNGVQIYEAKLAIDEAMKKIGDTIKLLSVQTNGEKKA